MPATTARGLRYPLSNEAPAGHLQMQALAGDTNDRLAIGGTASLTADGSGILTVTHGLGRVPVGYAAVTVNTTLYLCSAASTAPTSTVFKLHLFRRDTGAPVPSGTITVRWVAY